MVTSNQYDVVIRNGRVMDPETLFDDVRNIGIRGGRIVAITREALEDAAKVIDATEHVVAPGFIDTHHHWPSPMGYKLGLRDGRTTMMELEMGTLGLYVAEWYARREGTSQANFGTASSHEAARALVLDGNRSEEIEDYITARAATGWSLQKVDLEQGNQILRTMDEGLQVGAVGVGSTLGYMRNGVSAREAFEIQSSPLPTGARRASISATPRGRRPQRPTASRSCSPMLQPSARQPSPVTSTTPATTWCMSCLSACASGA